MSSLTCQIFDLQKHSSAEGIQLLLRSNQPNQQSFVASTSPDGDVKGWKNDKFTLGEFLKGVDPSQEIWWQMRCFLSPYFHGCTRFTVIDVNFKSYPKELHHISLYIGPSDYKTSITSRTISHEDAMMCEKESLPIHEWFRNAKHPKQLTTINPAHLCLPEELKKQASPPPPSPTGYNSDTASSRENEIHEVEGNTSGENKNWDMLHIGYNPSGCNLNGDVAIKRKPRLVLNTSTKRSTRLKEMQRR